MSIAKLASYSHYNYGCNLPTSYICGLMLGISFVVDGADV